MFPRTSAQREGAQVEGYIGGRWRGFVIQAAISLGRQGLGAKGGCFLFCRSSRAGKPEPSVSRAVPSIQQALVKCLLLLMGLEII